MKPLLSITVLLAAIAIYGYCLPRWIAQRFYTIANLLFGIVTVVFAALVGASRKNLGILVNKWSVVIAAILLVLLLLFIFSVVSLRNIKLRGYQYHQLFLRIPFGTALSEELVFRSALLGILLQNYSRLTAIIISSAAFGFWHVLPSPLNNWAHQNLPYKNISARQAKTLSESFTILFTAVGGAIFGWLRIASGSILLPWTAHTLTNAGGWIMTIKDKREKDGSN